MAALEGAGAAAMAALAGAGAAAMAALAGAGGAAMAALAGAGAALHLESEETRSMASRAKGRKGGDLGLDAATVGWAAFPT
jgi:hypothetical protein